MPLDSRRDFAEVVHHWDTENREEDQRNKKTDMLIEIKKEPLKIENISPLVDEFELSGPRLMRTVEPKRKNGFDSETAEVKITAKRTKK
ncbi:hypothetical protein RvY_02359 [Ramazzottius varieornatus]|uniref:Uncharacterized protein n=1 Tax=Ramazzottius varieornatus TaxID=947166 RepID=A0A1D1URH7_RAMVA|nr:hypothetical protein RvY_02359 [Ramazzottius varieornatus]